MSDNSWYARRVAQERGHPPPPAAPRTPPPYPQHPQPQIVGYLADGQPIYAAPPQAPAAPVQQPQFPQQQQHHQYPPMSEKDMIEAAIKGGQGITPMDVLNRVGAKGGRGTRTETELCPECGSNQYFKREALGKMSKQGKMAPAPYCHSCGYNGVFEQYGAQAVPEDLPPDPSQAGMFPDQ